MKVKVVAGKVGVEEANRLQAIAIVVDALRASATICTLFCKGVKEVWVVSEVSKAFELKNKFPEVLLIGERNNFKVPGFDFGNSPVEISLQPEKTFKGKIVVFTSTSGARRISACLQVKSLFVGSCVNAKWVAERARVVSQRFKKDVVIIPAGDTSNEERLSEEDMAAALKVAECTGLPIVKVFPEFKLEDSLEEVFLSSSHGKRLINAGFKKDVIFCSKENVLPSVPELVEIKSGVARLKESLTKD